MNGQESLALCRMAKGAFPASTMDEFTPEAWALALEDDDFGDAKTALKELMREQAFIHVSDIAKRVKRIRDTRILAFGPLPDPPEALVDDSVGYQRWLRATVRAIADGKLTTRPALPAPGSRPAIDFTKVFRSVDDLDETVEAS